MNRQRSTMISLMNTMTKSTDLYSQAINSAGTSTQIQEKYMESFNGKLGTLKASFESLSANALNGDFMKGSIDVLSGFIGALDKSTQTLGVLPTAITAVVGAMTLFNAKFRENTTITMQGLIPSYNKLVTNMQGIDKQLTSSIQKYKAQIDFQRKFATGQAQGAIATDNLGKSMIGLNAKLALSTTGLVACRFAAVALQAAMSMGLSLAITGAISLFSNLINASSKAKEEVKSLNQEFLNNKDAINTNKADVLVKQYESLQATLKTMKSGTDEFKEAENQLLQVEQKIIDTYPNASVSIDNNTQAKKLNLSMTKDLINADLELAKGSANDVLSKNKVDGSDNSIQTVIDGYENYKRVVEELNKYTADVGKGIRETTDFINVEVKAVDGSTNVWKVKTDSIGHYTDKLQEATESSKAIYEALVIMAEANGYSAEKIVELGKVLGLTDAQIAESTSGMTVFKDVVNEVSNITNNAVSSIDTLANSFSGLNQPIELLRTMIDEFTQFGQISDSSWNSVLTSGNTELIALLSDSNNFLANAQGLLDTNIAKQEDYAQSIINTAVAQQNASNAVIDGVNAEANATVNAENSKINASVMSANNRIDNERVLVDSNNKNFGIDSKNFSLFATAKQNASDTLANAMIDSTKSMVDKSNSNYAIDASNYVNYINTKINAFREFQKAQNGGFTISSDIMKDFEEVKKIRDEYNQLQKDIANSSGNAVNSYSGSGGVGGGVSHGAIGSSGTGGSGTGSSGSSATEKEIANLEVVAGKYYKLNDLISDNSRLLEKNKNAQKDAHGQDLIRLMDEEIDLMKRKVDLNNQLIDSYTAEANGAKIQLMAYGFEFDANNNLINSYERLIQLKQEANSKTGVDKENAQGYIKTLETLIESFNTITNNTIPNLQGEIESVNNSMKDLYKDQANLIADSENEISKLIEYEARKRYDAKKESIEKEMKLEEDRLNKLKESIQKEKDLYNKGIEEDDYNSNLAKERQKLAEIQAEIDRLSSATDAKSKAMLQSLMNDYKTQQDAINQMIKDKVQSDTNERFDSESNLLDDQIEQSKDKFEAILDELENDLNEFLKPENLSKLVQDGIVSGFVTIGDETVNLTSAMKNMIQESTVGFTNMTLELNEFINGLKDATSLYGNLNNIISGANLSGLNLVGGNISRSASSVNVTMGNLTIQGSVSESNLGDIQSMLDRQKNDVIKEISKQLNSR